MDRNLCNIFDAQTWFIRNYIFLIPSHLISDTYKVPSIFSFRDFHNYTWIPIKFLKNFMDACETLGNQRVLFSRKRLDHMRAFLVHTLFIFQFF